MVITVWGYSTYFARSKIDYRIAPRRAGDAPLLVASAKKAHRILEWEPTESDLVSIIASAWRWEKGRTPK